MRTPLLAALIACAVACNAPTAGTGAAPTDGRWTAAGEAACTRYPVPDEDPPCPATAAVYPSGVGVWDGRTVVPLESVLSNILVPGLDNAAILRCDLARFPLPRTCMARTTCDGADVVVFASYVHRIAVEYVRAGGCW